jgi:hypothetical protein
MHLNLPIKRTLTSQPTHACAIGFCSCLVTPPTLSQVDCSALEEDLAALRRLGELRGEAHATERTRDRATAVRDALAQERHNRIVSQGHRGLLAQHIEHELLRLSSCRHPGYRPWHPLQLCIAVCTAVQELTEPCSEHICPPLCQHAGPRTPAPFVPPS